MTKTALEATQPLLKANPGARPITQRDRGPKPQHDPGSDPQPDFGRHRRKCRVCKHPDREEIEQEFLRWKSSAAIAEAYGLPDHSSVCRHARAVGLYHQRRRTIQYALEPVLEQSETVAMQMTVGTLISAVAAYAKINDDGVRPRKPPDVVYQITMDDYERMQKTTPPAAAANSQIQELEDDSTH
jgi:hypothetical protein